MNDLAVASRAREGAVRLGAQLAPALRRLLKFAYDEENQLIAEVDALGGAVRYAYDAPGNVIALTDENGNTTNFEFDRNNRTLKETKPEVTDPVTGSPTRYTILHRYDANGNEIASTDENGHTTTFAFDKDNRVVLVTDANGIKTVFTYDSRNNVTHVTIGAQAQEAERELASAWKHLGDGARPGGRMP